MTIEETHNFRTQADGHRVANLPQPIVLYVSVAELKAITVGAVLTKRMYNGEEAQIAGMMLNCLRSHLTRKHHRK